jgi:S-adenosylmethionine decarboxylase
MPQALEGWAFCPTPDFMEWSTSEKNMNFWEKTQPMAHKDKAFILLLLMKKGLCKVSMVLFLAITSSMLNANEPYHFYGRHLIAQYYDCDHSALCDTRQLAAAMKQATQASGAHLLTVADYTFEGNGYTMVLLLSESHASIHTYPEYNACFVDLFTCGQKCSATKFDAALREYLKPKRVESKVQERR